MKGLKPKLSVVLLIVLSVGLRSPEPPPNKELIEPISLTIEKERIFIADLVTGIQVYDVADRAAPTYVMTIPVRENRASAIKDDILYANDLGSLLAIRIGDDGYEVVKEIKSQPEYHSDLAFHERHDRGYGCACSTGRDVVAPNGTFAGGGGSSFATFAVIDDYLYYLDDWTLITADITVPADPQVIGRTPIGWQIETLYPTQDYLFIGGTRGMFIFDRRDPASPEMIGHVQHFRGCDPVVVSGDIAFVTLRGGNVCGQAPDVLLCIDIKNPAKPTIIGERSMKTPHGLAVENHLLYVSKGTRGFVLLDVNTPASPTKIAGWADRPTRDFIWSGATLYTLGFDNVMIFDVSTPEAPALVSEIAP